LRSHAIEDGLGMTAWYQAVGRICINLEFEFDLANAGASTQF
jgi:hypothetical protein